MKHHLSHLLGAAVALTMSAKAATPSWSTTAPVVDGADISNFAGVSADMDNINGGNDEGTYVAGDRSAVGQTFTTGSNPEGYVLKAITLQHVTYENTWWSVDEGWNGLEDFEVKVGIKDGIDSFTPLITEDAPLATTGIAVFDVVGPQNGTGTGAFLTLTLETPLVLAPNTTYGFTVWSAGPFFETNGDGNTSDNYEGGEAFGVMGTLITDFTGDHVFHLDLEAPGAGPTLQILKTGFAGDQFEITAGGLEPGREYTLFRSSDLTDGFPVIIQTITAGSTTEVFTDLLPPGGKAFYRIME